jgi:hypothetical protein
VHGGRGGGKLRVNPALEGEQPRHARAGGKVQTLKIEGLVALRVRVLPADEREKLSLKLKNTVHVVSSTVLFCVFIILPQNGLLAQVLMLSTLVKI